MLGRGFSVFGLDWRRRWGDDVAAFFVMVFEGVKLVDLAGSSAVSVGSLLRFL